MEITDLQKDILASIQRIAKRSSSDTAFWGFLRTQHRSSGHAGYGLRASDLRLITASFRPRFRELGDDDRLELARRLFQTRSEEPTQVALALQQMSLAAITPDRFTYLDDMMDRCSSWSVCDGFSLYIMQPLLMIHYEPVARLLRGWSCSDNMWKRRASAVTFARRAGESGRYVDLVLELSDALVNDPEDLVQKGVGWALKDNLRGNHKKVLAYIKELRRRGISSTITLYAIRDLGGSEREAVLRIKARRNR